MTECLRLAMSRSVVRRALWVTLVVGSILVAINHGDAVLNGDISAARVLRIFLTVLVPYCVSTYSSVSALRDRTKGTTSTSSSIPELAIRSRRR